jgi:hypothetical protein
MKRRRATTAKPFRAPRGRAFDALARRFLAHVDLKRTESGCVLFVGATTSAGYGSVSVDGRTVLAHRVAFALTSKPLKTGALVLHARRCRSSRCVNPDHLRAGSASANLSDSWASGKRAARRRATGDTSNAGRGHV